MKKKVYVLIVFFLAVIMAFSDKIILKTTFQIAPPKYYIEDNEVKGICYEIYEELNKRLEKYNIEIQWDGKFKNMTYITEELSKGFIDIFIGIAKNDYRENIMNFSDFPLYSVTYMILTNKDFNKSLNELKLGVIKGTKTEQLFFEVTKNKNKAIEFENIEEAINPYLKNKIEGVFYNSLTLGYYYNKSLKKISKIVNMPMPKYYHYIGFSRKVSEDIKNIVDKEIKEIVINGTVEKILEKYGLKEFAKPGNYLKLANVDWPPYEWYENGEWKGIDTEVLKRVFENMGFKVDIIYLNWLRVLDYIKKGIIDGTFSLSVTDERRKYMLFSEEPLSTGADVFIYKNKNINFEDDISNYKCGYVKGFNYNDRLKDFNLQYYAVSDDIIGIKGFINDRFDIYVIDKNVALYYLKKFNYKGQVYFYPISKKNMYYIGLSRKNEFSEEIIKMFNEELKRFKKTEEYREILKKYNITYEDLWQ
ncbi:hypothetical protein XO10_09565 [Marinitoga sp. 1135]|uniref:substrate-binding periplasmic protein n=1 Tax=Marinitoga sp. 1135 TaxID=1643333 RepID=UPI0015869C73|nr:transporter substrate-binding domain-containing protein [Marinitoga sp. 1135]NUU96496.1 hypothetical protein [Marinitoga sp. 1135]